MKRFVEGTDRRQSTLFPERLEDWIDENNSVQVIDAFVDELDLAEMGFAGVAPEVTGRPAYHPSVLLKALYLRLPQSGSVEPAARARGLLASIPPSKTIFIADSLKAH